MILLQHLFLFLFALFFDRYIKRGLNCLANSIRFYVYKFLGLNNINELTKQQSCRLHVDLRSSNDDHAYSVYRLTKINFIIILCFWWVTGLIGMSCDVQIVFFNKIN